MVMWRLVCVALMAINLLIMPVRSYGQAEELAQLALNIEKLAELKKILSNMIDGYKILTQGYDKIKDIASGNYKLHQVFLDGLYVVSPAIKKYRRVPDIIANQATILSEYRAAFSTFRDINVFSADDLAYFGKVYDGLMKECAVNLEELLVIITSNEARMSDDERLAGIDRIFRQTEDKVVFLRDFNESTRLFAMRKLKERSVIESLRTIYEK